MAQQNRQGAPLREKTPRTCSNPFRMVTSKSPTCENCESEDVTCVSLLDLFTIYLNMGNLNCSAQVDDVCAGEDVFLGPGSLTSFF